MSFELSHITLIGILYLMMLFGIAYATNRGWIPRRISRHPITYVLSLGIFFSAWSFYGVVDLANEFGYSALAYYMGTGAFFLFAPVIQAPLAELCQRFQLRSIADLLVFRYNSQIAGSLATLCMLLAILPLSVIQVQSVADTLQILTSETSLVSSNFEAWIKQRDITAFFYCLLMAIFCMTFGASYRQYRGLMTTMAFESLIKMFAMLIVGLFAVYGVFGGFQELDQWLLNNPEYLDQLHNNDKASTSHSLLLVFLAASVLMPHIFHMSHVDMSIKRLTRMVTWAFPLLLLVVALPVFPILWAGFALESGVHPSYFTLGVPMQAGSHAVTIIAYIGGVSAASGALIIAILALATMIANHWVLPLLKLKTEKDIYAQLRWLQRVLILVIALTSYAIYQVINYRYSLVDLTLITFIQALQFLPGVVAINYFPFANRYGFYAGIISGTSVWACSFILPIIINATSISMPGTHYIIHFGIEYWENTATIALGLNIIIFALVSRFTTMSDDENYHAELCAEDELSRPFRRRLDISSAQEFKQRLAESLGQDAANKEVNQALQFLELDENETRPYSLRRLRTRIQTNLAALMGQSVANDLIDKHFPYSAPQSGEVIDINLMEKRLERLGRNMHGLTADIKQLRLHHRNTLQELPIAICSLGMDDEVLLWNQTMINITGITSNEITGSSLKNLPEPWGQMISDFANNNETHINKQAVDLSGNQRWYRLHKSAIKESPSQRKEGQVILIEDITELQMLEQELMHNTRLSSIGRLAAGVAHEIGNPVTGIACLAQNLQYEDQAEERQQTVEAILSQTNRISRIVQSLVTFAHSGKASQDKFHQVNIAQSIDEAIHLLSLQKDRKAIEYQNMADKDLNIWGDGQQIIQVFINLLSNANDASPEYSTVSFITETKQQLVYIDITDEGAGIAREYIDQIMDPFFTTKEAGKGTGLGLSVVFSIIEEHQGSVEVTSPVAANRGTRFTIKLPLYAEALATVSDPVHTNPTWSIYPLPAAID